jgi:CubicO group peptidase (beta-lactamase class C family)
VGIDKNRRYRVQGRIQLGGAAGTAFWVDPKEDMIGIFIMQVMPQRTVKDQFKQLAYQAIVGERK